MAKKVDEYLDEISYEFRCYMPSDEALLFVNFIKEVNDGSEENETPLIHLVMMDTVFNGKRRCAVLVSRGMAKTTLFAEYLILFMAAFGYFPGFGPVNLALYVTDSIENGVKNLRRNVEFRYSNSVFLQRLIPNQKIKVGRDGANFVEIADYEAMSAGGTKFTDIRLEFENNKGHKLVVKGYGAKTGVRGAKEMGQRPPLAIFDDLISDSDAHSPAIIASIENTIYKAVSKALHPTRQKMVWLGTPFNQNDPLYKAVESGAWEVACFPVCEHFDSTTTKEEFVGAWEDRFPYEYVKAEFDEAMKLGRPSDFYQELMLRISSEEDRLIPDSDIIWYDRSSVLSQKNRFNFYITTDMATSESKTADFSVIYVWAINANGDRMLIDGWFGKVLLSEALNMLFTLAQKYRQNLLGVGIEVSGQQGGFVAMIQEKQIRENNYFSLLSYGNSNKPGIRPSTGTNKYQRFLMIQPYFNNHKIWFPTDWKDTPIGIELMNEIRGVSRTNTGAKIGTARHDDLLDPIAMLAMIEIISPSNEVHIEDKKEEGVYYTDIDELTDESLANQNDSYSF
jgi:phage terminase large subunit-like protein